MPSSPPDVALSTDDKRLLLLLARLIAAPDDSPGNYQRADEVVLADAEAGELVGLLEEFSRSRRFIEGSHFIEMLFSGGRMEEQPAREIYLSWRKRRGRSRAMASTHWQEFLVRLGLSRERGGYWRAAPIVHADRMTTQKFLTLERALLESSDLNARVRELVLRVVTAQSAAIESIRDGEKVLPRGDLTRLPMKIAQEVDIARRTVGVQPMSTQKVAGIITIVADMSVLFTTRDWSVVGTLSPIAGALVAATE